MPQSQRPVALDLWLDAGLGLTDWSAPLSSSALAMRAKALALARVSGSVEFAEIGVSPGAPIEFVNLCRDLCGAGLAVGVQTRYVAGLGHIAWRIVVGPAAAVVLFGLYNEPPDLDSLGDIAVMAERCVAARERAQAAIRPPPERS